VESEPVAREHIPVGITVERRERRLEALEILDVSSVVPAFGLLLNHGEPS